MTAKGGLAAVGHTLAANVFILAASAGTGIITARWLGPVGRGELAAIVLWPQILSASITLGLPSALLYNLKRYPERTSQLFSAALPLGALTGVISTVVGVLLIPHWLTEYQPEVIRFAQWGVVLLVSLGTFYSTFMVTLQAREEFSLYNLVRYAVPLGALLILGLLILTADLTPFNAALAYWLPSVPIFLWMLVRLWRLYQPTFRNLGWASKRLLSFGVRSSGIDLLGQLSVQTDRVLVVGFLTPASMGLYVVALGLAQLIMVFSSAVTPILLPKAAGRSTEEVLSLTERAAGGSIAAALVAAVGLALFSPWALRVLYGAEYLDAVPVFRLLLVAVILAGAHSVLLQAFMALDRPGLVTIEQVVGLGLTVPLLLMLVPRYGLEGAGLAVLISVLVRFVLVLASFPLILKARIPRLWPTRDDLVNLAARFDRNKEGT